MTRLCIAATLIWIVSLSAQAQAATYEQEVMADNPFVYYRLEEESGTEASDTSGNEIHGEYVDGVELNQPSATDGLGRSASFDGFTGYVQMPILDLVSPQLTIEVWIYLEALAGGCCTSIFSPDGWEPGWLHYNIKGDQNFEFALNGGGPNNHNTEPGTIPFEEWTHIASVYDADEALVQSYVNGELVDTFPEEFSTPLEVALIVEAQVAAWQNTRFLGGSLDEFAIYDTALTEERILAHFEAASGTSLRGDYNNNGELDTGDLDLQAIAIRDGGGPEFDLNDDGLISFPDREVWVNDLKNTWIGDANLDLEFNSSDMVQVFVRGKYEKDEDALWEEGDWDGNLRFNSGDMVAAFVAGGYEKGMKDGDPNPAVSAVPEPGGWLVLLLGLVSLVPVCRRG